jgi:hypothetical protein
MGLEEELLLKEHDRVGTAIMTLYVALERGMALAFGVAGLTAAFGKGHVAAVFLPILLGVIVLYVLDHLNEIMVLGGYKIYLEKRLNSKLSLKEDGSSSGCGRVAQ